jgi:hypothetical protein
MVYEFKGGECGDALSCSQAGTAEIFGRKNWNWLGPLAASRTSGGINCEFYSTLKLISPSLAPQGGLLPVQCNCEVGMSKNRCENCGSTKFGLVRQRWFRFQFCSTVCKADFLVDRKRHIKQTILWLRGTPQAGHGARGQPTFAADYVGTLVPPKNHVRA